MTQRKIEIINPERKLPFIAIHLQDPLKALTQTSRFCTLQISDSKHLHNVSYATQLNEMLKLKNI